MTDLKYILRKTGLFSSRSELIAMRDIPEHGVKEGDIGGTVDKHVKLSHGGSCWIGHGAYVAGNVSILENAYIGDTARVISEDNTRVVIKGQARIFGNAYLKSNALFRADGHRITMICGNAQIYGSVFLDTVEEVSGSARVFGSAKVRPWASITDTSEVSGKAEIHSNVAISGASVITDNVVVEFGSVVKDSHLTGSLKIEMNQTIVNGESVSSMTAAPASLITPANTDAIIEHAVTTENLRKVLEHYPEAIKKSLFGKVKFSSQKSSAYNDALLTFQEVMDSMASYETDIAKIIQYPVMTDRTDPYTRAMVSASNKAKRYFHDPESSAFQEAVIALEEAFLAAESNARKLAATMLSDTAKKQAEKAKDLLALASNESSSEQEKKVAFIQGFKQLEGVIDVPDAAKDTFRVKIGLQEIEA